MKVIHAPRRFRSVKPTECEEMMMFKANIMECIKKMFGLVGTETWGFDLIELKERTALIRVYRSYVSSVTEKFRLSTYTDKQKIHALTQALDTTMVSTNTRIPEALCGS